MTATKTVYERAMERKLALEKSKKREQARKRAGRTVLSLAIPFFAALLLSAAGTFIFHANHNASFSYNLWYFFCKSVFPCLPFMVWFIVHK